MPVETPLVLVSMPKFLRVLSIRLVEAMAEVIGFRFRAQR
jgi:hypothetical protein